jgi:hypothetical protein
MPREVIEPTVNEDGDERHPAFGLISASRVSSSPGASLFDSEIQHQHYVTVRISTCVRKRDLNRDWLFGDRAPFVEVAMSEAQWAQFVSSMNAGQGTACTIQRREDGDVPGVPYAPRLEKSMDEVHGAADKALEQIRAAFAAYQERKTVGNLRSLESAIRNAPSNMRFAAKSLTEHAENVVQKARADIEAMVVNKAQQLGVEAGDLGGVAQIAAPADDDTAVGG